MASRDERLTITLPADLAKRLSAAAAEAGVTAEALAASCVEQHLDVAARHMAVIDRLEGVDAALLELAQFVGEAAGASEGFDPSRICRYCPPDTDEETVGSERKV